jgi:hypothetical protein
LTENDLRAATAGGFLSRGNSLEPGAALLGVIKYLKNRLGESPKIPQTKLSEITGFERARLSQLAGKGYYPPLDKGSYDLFAFLTGLCKYFREARERSTVLKESILKTKDAMQKLELAEMEKRILPKEKVCADMKATGLGIRGMFQRAFETEWPARAVGKTQIEMVEIGRQMTDKLCAEFRVRADAWLK